MANSPEAHPAPPQDVVKDGRIDPQVRRELINVSDKEFGRTTEDSPQLDDTERMMVEGFTPQQMESWRRHREGVLIDIEDQVEDLAWEAELDEDQEEELRLLVAKMKLDKDITKSFANPDRDATLNQLIADRARNIIHMADGEYADFIKRWKDTQAISFAREYRTAEEEAHAEDYAFELNKKVHQQLKDADHEAALAEDEAHNDQRMEDLYSGKLSFEEFKAKYPYLAYKYSNDPDSPYGRPTDARPDLANAQPQVVEQLQVAPGQTLDRRAPDGTHFHWEVVSVSGGQVVVRLSRRLPDGHVVTDRPRPIQNVSKFVYDLQHPDSIDNGDWTVTVRHSERGRRHALRSMVIGGTAVNATLGAMRATMGGVDPVPARQSGPSQVQIDSTPIQPGAPDGIHHQPEIESVVDSWAAIGVSEEVWDVIDGYLFHRFPGDFSRDDQGNVAPRQPFAQMSHEAQEYIRSVGGVR